MQRSGVVRARVSHTEDDGRNCRYISTNPHGVSFSEGKCYSWSVLVLYGAASRFRREIVTLRPYWSATEPRHGSEGKCYSWSALVCYGAVSRFRREMLLLVRNDPLRSLVQAVTHRPQSRVASSWIHSGGNSTAADFLLVFPAFLLLIIIPLLLRTLPCVPEACGSALSAWSFISAPQHRWL
jgi:hypothetical protein